MGGSSVAQQDFVLLAKLEDLDVETHKIVQRFQKSERHVLSASIRDNLEAISFLIIRASKDQLEDRHRGRPPIRTLEGLRQADTRLEYFKLQIRKAYRLKQIDDKTYGYWTGMARECGGLLGGWLKKVEPYGNSPKRPQQNSLL